MPRARRFIPNTPITAQSRGIPRDYGDEHDEKEEGDSDDFEDDLKFYRTSGIDHKLKRRIKNLQRAKKKYKARYRYFASIFTVALLVAFVWIYFFKAPSVGNGLRQTNMSWLLPDHLDVLDVKGFEDTLTPRQKENAGGHIEKWYKWKVGPWTKGGEFCNGMVDEVHCQAAREKYEQAKHWYVNQFVMENFQDSR